MDEPSVNITVSDAHAILVMIDNHVENGKRWYIKDVELSGLKGKIEKQIKMQEVV